MKPNILIYLLMLLFAVACKKEGGKYTTVVQGIITDKLTEERVAGVPIELIGCEFIGISTKCLETLTTVHTDDYGRYKIVYSSGWKSLKLAIGVNEKVGWTQYPYYHNIETGKDNWMDFSQYPLKNLILGVHINKPQKNFLQLYLFDSMGESNYYLYSGLISMPFDTTYRIKVEAGKNYNFSSTLTNKIAPYEYVDRADTSISFSVPNVDTTFKYLVIE